MGMKDRFRADRDFINGVLNDADDMVIALNDGDGAPYAFPVNFVLLGDALYIHTAFNREKMDLNPQEPPRGVLRLCGCPHHPREGHNHVP